MPEKSFNQVMNDALTDNVENELLDVEELSNYDAKQFWKQIEANWLVLYKGFFTDNQIATLEAINNLLPDDDLEIEATTNMINGQSLEAYDKFVEFYISPKLKKISVYKMKKLYEERIELPWLRVSCYKAYHPKDSLIADISYTNFKVNYNDLWFQSTFGYDGKNPIINIVIIVKNPPADNFLVQKTIKFYDGDKAADNNLNDNNANVNNNNLNDNNVNNLNDNNANDNNLNDNNLNDNNLNDNNLNDNNLNDNNLNNNNLNNNNLNVNENKTDSKTGFVGSREVWIQNDYFPVDIALLNILGEYNLIHHVGYIEILHEKDPLVKADAKFFELQDLKKQMDILFKHYKYKHCNYCQHNSLQTNLFKCSKCNSGFYCCKICQRADWQTHKLICNK